MVRLNTQKRISPSAKSTGGKGAKKKKIKPGLYLTVVGDAKFFVLNVGKNGKTDRTELKQEVVAECVIHCITEGVKELVKDIPEEELKEDK